MMRESHRYVDPEQGSEVGALFRLFNHALKETLENFTLENVEAFLKMWDMAWGNSLAGTRHPKFFDEPINEMRRRFHNWA